MIGHASYIYICLFDIYKDGHEYCILRNVDSVDLSYISYRLHCMLSL